MASDTIAVEEPRKLGKESEKGMNEVDMADSSGAAPPAEFPKGEKRPHKGLLKQRAFRARRAERQRQTEQDLHNSRDLTARQAEENRILREENRYLQERLAMLRDVANTFSSPAHSHNGSVLEQPGPFVQGDLYYRDFAITAHSNDVTTPKFANPASRRKSGDAVLEQTALATRYGSLIYEDPWLLSTRSPTAHDHDSMSLSKEVNQGTGNVLTRDHSEAVLTAHPQPLPQVPVHLSSESAANSLQLTAIKEVPVLRDDTQDVSDSPFAALQLMQQTLAPIMPYSPRL